MFDKHKILKSVDKKLVANDIKFILIPSYIGAYVDTFFNKEDLLCFDTLSKSLSKDQLDKFKHLNSIHCSNTFNDNYIQSNPNVIRFLSSLPLYHSGQDLDPSGTVGETNPNRYFRKMEPLIDSIDVDAILKVFDTLAANYCQRFTVKELKPQVYGIFLSELELIDSEALNKGGSLDHLKTTRFIDDVSPLIDELSEKYTVDYVTQLEMFAGYSDAYSGVSELWV